MYHKVGEGEKKVFPTPSAYLHNTLDYYTVTAAAGAAPER